MIRPLPSVVLVGLGALFAGCVGQEESTSEPNEPLGRTENALTVDQAGQGVCETTVVKGLSQQIIAQANCIKPGAYAKVPDLANVTMSATVFPYLELPARDAFVDAANAAPNMSITINSMLRTVAQQYLLYHWYTLGQCGISLAAKPGSSPHETGLALDTSQYSAWKSTLQSHGFKWHGAGDLVHFDYVGPGAVDNSGTDVLAFQQLWNKNHPEDPIGADGSWGAQTQARIAISPADGFPMGANCGVTPPAGPDVQMSIDLPGAADVFADGASSGVVDTYEADHGSLVVRFTNSGGMAASKVVIGIESDDAFSLDDYLIESDWMNGGAFQKNEANEAPENPSHGALAATTTLDLHVLSPGESKRVTLPLTAVHYSVGQAQTPSIRVYVKEIPNVYSATGFGGSITDPKGQQTFNMGRLEVAQRADVYGRTHWEWESNRLEGFTASEGATVLVDGGFLKLTGGTSAAFAKGPDTGFDARDAPFITLRAKRLLGTGDARLAFLTDPLGKVDDALAFPIDLPADGAFHEIVIDTSSHPGFVGSIHGLALVPFSGSPGEFAIDYLRAGDGASIGATPDPKNRAGDPADCTCGLAAHNATPWAPLASGLAALGAVFVRRRSSPKGSRAV